jgi:hypothetical protein
MEASRLGSGSLGDRLLGNFILLGLIASVVITLYFTFSPRQHLGYLGPLFFFIFLVVFTTVGIILGEKFRVFTKPDRIYTQDASETFSKKIYWLIGPQLTGYMIGLAFTIVLFKGVFHYSILMGRG